MKTIIVPTPFRPFTDDQKRVAVSGDTVGAALQDLTQRYPELRPHIYSEAGELHPFVNIFLNEDEIRSLQGEETPLKDGERLIIAAAISGGV